jgi:hypothetical protein
MAKAPRSQSINALDPLKVLNRLGMEPCRRDSLVIIGCDHPSAGMTASACTPALGPFL